MKLTPQEHAVMQAMDRMRKIRLNLLFPELSTADGHLLGILLAHEGGMTVSELAQELDLPMPAVSRGMRSLEERGLIVRTIRPEDRRHIIVRITETGRQTMDRFYACYHAFFTELMTPPAGAEAMPFEEILTNWNTLMDRMELLLRQQTQQAAVPTADALAAAQTGPEADSETIPMEESE